MSIEHKTSTSTSTRNPLRNLLTYLHRKKTRGDQKPMRNDSIASASTCVGSEFEKKGKDNGKGKGRHKDGDENGNVDGSEDIVHHEAMATSLALK